ncbi:ABC transporter ATP-binding protein [Virgisporangium aliadipatigenens]|uniref:ABC transporter ATP-binding protein n=1 Tax=Virgisporangium aliadipatigenens TaxID=741659 RepID=A0A8J4DNY5_9ACTN|nr:ABC transporter ATP-binding protein [Virgisporangium aliadipatigenens]GIJ44306.1 ABC transporter ATP-binding protein [Virgisporangium aliadipatigenens]
MTAALEATGLGRRYGKHWALKDCTLHLPAGRIAALVGPNGAGKSTLLHLAVGLLGPSSGTVSVFGATPGDPKVRGDVGFVAQDTPLYPDFSATELATLGTKLNRRFDRALMLERLNGLNVAVDRPVPALSGGQRAQVALALALAKRPRLLLLDEPVASLDPLARREFLQALMGGVADEGTTILLSSHLLGDLERVCDYLVLLQAGRVQVLGGVDELVAQHRLLTGPLWTRDAGSINGVAAVVRQSHTERQTTLLVRTDDSAPAPGWPDPQWTVSDVSLEDIILAYLADAGAGTLPGPRNLHRVGGSA